MIELHHLEPMLAILDEQKATLDIVTSTHRVRIAGGEPMPTICRDCKHADFSGANALCLAGIEQREERTNYVTGNKYKLPVYCSDRNQGSCPFYQAAEVSTGPQPF